MLSLYYSMVAELKTCAEKGCPQQVTDGLTFTEVWSLHKDRKTIPGKYVHHGMETHCHMTPFCVSKVFSKNSVESSPLVYHAHKASKAQHVCIHFSPTNYTYSSGDYQKSGPVSKLLFLHVLYLS